MTDSIPTGNTIEVALDRLQRASNFAGNCAYVGKEVGITPEQIAVYIRSARSMLDEAERVLAEMHL